MIKKALLLFSLAALSLNASAQISNEIASYVDSTEILINNSRKLLAKTLSDKNIPKTKDIYNYLINIEEKSNCLSLYYNEDLIVSALTNNWERWSYLATKIKSIEKNNCYNNLYSISDLLYKKLSEEGDSINKNYQTIPVEGQEAANIFITLTTKGVDDNYNKQIKNYKKNYSKSEYSDFVLDYLPKPAIKASWGFSLGANQLFLTSNLKNSFNNATAFCGSMDFNINKIYTSIYIGGGDLILREPFNATNKNETLTFTTGDHFIHFNAGIKVGYFGVRTNKIHIAPYLGFGGVSLKSDIYEIDVDKEDLEVTLYDSFMMDFGVHTELKILSFQAAGNAYNYGGPVKHHISFKIDAGYNLITNQKNDMFSGNMIYINPAIVWAIGDF